MAWIRFDSAILRQGETWLRASTTNYPLPDSFLLLLCLTDGAVNRASTPTQVLATELAQSNGYSRKPLVFGEGSYDSLQKRGEWVAGDVLVSAVGQSLQYDAVVVWALPPGVTDLSAGWPELINLFGATQTIFAETSHTFRVSWNFLNVGDIDGV